MRISAVAFSSHNSYIDFDFVTDEVKDYIKDIKQDLLINKVYSECNVKIDGVKRKHLYQTNPEALKAFQNRRINQQGTLSTTLWNQSNDYLDELEKAIGTAIKKGTSAITLSKQVSKYLKDFDTLRKDYKNTYGKAIDIKDCEYRAARLARSEINMAYRTAEQQRWQQMDFVLGYEIQLSKSHKEIDICDELCGRYPKDFVWTGWHPNDKCYSVPILMDEDDFLRVQRGEEPIAKPIKDLPDNFKNWVANNQEKIKQAKSLPYFLRDNGRLTKDGYILNQFGEQETKKPTALQIAEQRHANRTPEQIEKIKRRWEERKSDNLDKQLEAMQMYQDLRTAKINGYLNADVDLDAIYRDIKGGYFNRALSRLKILTSAVKRHTLRTQAQIDSIKQAWNNRPVTLLKSYTTNAQVEQTFKQINDKLADKWFVRGDLKLAIEKNPSLNGSTNMFGKIWLNPKRLDDVLTALSKIGRGKSIGILYDEADAMATFWHEITHNRNISPYNSKTWNVTKDQTRVMEMMNEFVARKTLPEFYGKLGVKDIPHPHFMDNRPSCGYNDMVVGYDFVIKTLGLDATKVLESAKKNLFTQNYNNQKETAIQALLDGGLDNYKCTNGKKITKAQVYRLVVLCREEYTTAKIKAEMIKNGIIP